MVELKGSSSVSKAGLSPFHLMVELKDWGRVPFAPFRAFHLMVELKDDVGSFD